MATGRVLVPINFRLDAHEIGFIVEHSGAEVVLYDPDVADAASTDSTSNTLVRLDGVARRRVVRASALARAVRIARSRPRTSTCSINYTSGTTAHPKGVQLTHRNCWLNAASFGWHVGVSDRDVLLHTLPMFHANGWGMPYAATAMAARHVVLRKVDGEEILRRVERRGRDAPVRRAGGGGDDPRRRGDEERRRAATSPVAGPVRIVVAGAPPPRQVIERVEAELGWEFIQIYGLTETSPLLTINRAPREWDGRRAAGARRAARPSGRPRRRRRDRRRRRRRDARTVEPRLRELLEPARRDRSRRSRAAGSTPATVASSTVGYAVITDRKKDVIITGGENVSSIEVEDCLFQHPAVAEVAVIGVPDETWGESVKALVVLRDGHRATEAELIDALPLVSSPTSRRPKSVEFRDELARTATGKLQKFKLRAPYWEGHERAVN